MSQQILVSRVDIKSLLNDVKIARRDNLNIRIELDKIRREAA